jgi:signal transduction histidine kinase/HAMP domain-containing protein
MRTKTLYSKILLLAGILGVFLAFTAILSFYTVGALNDRDRLRKSESNMLVATQRRIEFSKTRDSLEINTFKAKIQEFEKGLLSLNDPQKLQKLNSLKQEYSSLFNYYADRMKIRGFDESKGIEGAFRQSVHTMEEVVNELNSYKLYVDILQARRSEKDYIMRRADKYIGKVENSIDGFIAHLPELNLDKDRFNHTVDLAMKYKYSFKQLVSIFKEINDIEFKLGALENQIQVEVENLVKEKSDKADLIEKILYSLVGASIIASFFLSIYIARNITKPIIELNDAALKIADGDFDVAVKVHSDDEIGNLGASFNIMSKNIKSSNDTIMEQQDRLQDSNIELEQLAEELKKSFNNLSLLSHIGKSLTSSLKYQSLLEQISEELKNILDYSCLAIGEVNKDSGYVEYGLIINRDVKQNPARISMLSSNRYDTLSVANAKEIFICNVNQADAEFEKAYPFINPNQKYITFDIYSKSIICIPISSGKEVIGVINIENVNKDAYKRHDLDTLRNLASYIGIAFMNAKSFQQLSLAHEEASRANSELKEAQAQLIQAEKLASLGQLSAGIAHEIKNPLNFITNYSDGSAELLEEFKDELQKLSQDGLAQNKIDELNASIEEIEGYLKTIVGNSKRIDNIVKTMMMHARAGSGEKAKTKMSAFIQEFCKLAYNGFRARSKEFTANIRYSNIDPEISCDIMQQEISRVLTNIIDNSCYSMNKKKIQSSIDFMPTIDVKCENIADKVYIKIRDNGLGIPQEAIDKIFNPFFTTKPAGEGTGLGLSLSYDIIKNGHGGDLIVNSMNGEYAEFTIVLPSSGSRY